jgi:hypothetical protein
MNMKTLLGLTLFLLCFNNAHAQKITGLWYSGDSTRIYEIKEMADNEYTATIKSSSRKGDSIGYNVIRCLKYNAQKKRYEGIIYAVSDNQPAIVKFRVKKNADVIILKLSRMFIMNVSIYWKKVAT